MVDITMVNNFKCNTAENTKMLLIIRLVNNIQLKITYYKSKYAYPK